MLLRAATPSKRAHRTQPHSGTSIEGRDVTICLHSVSSWGFVQTCPGEASLLVPSMAARTGARGNVRGTRWPGRGCG